MLAVAFAIIDEFATGSTSPNLEAEFGLFELGHLAMQKAITDKLTILRGGTQDYSNLRAFKGAVDFNGRSYTLKDLVNSKFPSDNQGALYVVAKNAAYDDFRKNLWNLMIMKTGESHTRYWGGYSISELLKQK